MLSKGLTVDNYFDWIKQQNRSPRNNTLTLLENDVNYLREKLLKITEKTKLDSIINKTINQDLFQVLDWLPEGSVDLLFADPPYNLGKTFNSNSFSSMELDCYEEWLETWVPKLLRVLKKTASIYICGDWRSSSAIHRVLSRHDLIVRNRISWEREKGRGSKTNWKNCSEDIWFATVSNDYTFNVDAVKTRRKVIAPYRIDGKPKDWVESSEGNFRDTHPSNFGVI